MCSTSSAHCSHCGAGTDPDSITWVVTYTVNTSDTDGAVTFTVDYEDAAGNAGVQETEADVTDQTVVVVDQTAPQLEVMRIVSSNCWFPYKHE